MDLMTVLAAFLVVVVGLPLGLLLMAKAHRQHMDNMAVRAERLERDKARKDELKFHYENFP